MYCTTVELLYVCVHNYSHIDTPVTWKVILTRLHISEHSFKITFNPIEPVADHCFKNIQIVSSKGGSIMKFGSNALAVVRPTGVYLLDSFCSGIQFYVLLSRYLCFVSF